jgi:hypothetical protein
MNQIQLGITSKIRNIDAYKENLSGFYFEFSVKIFHRRLPLWFMHHKRVLFHCLYKHTYINEIIKWCEKVANQQYFTSEGFNGEDLANIAMPQLKNKTKYL